MKYGFHKISLDSLVAELKTSKSSLYNHFKSKEDLVYQVLSQMNLEINSKLETIMQDKKLSFYGKLSSIMEFTGNLLNESGEEFLHDLKIFTPDLWHQYMNMRKDRINRYYKRLFEMGMEEGMVRKDLNPALVLSAYFKLTEISVNSEDLRGLNLNNQEAYQQISTLFLEGIRNQN